MQSAYHRSACMVINATAPDPAAPGPLARRVLRIERRYNVALTDAVAVTTDRECACRGAVAVGLVPHWAKDPGVGARMINARADGGRYSGLPRRAGTHRRSSSGRLTSGSPRGGPQAAVGSPALTTSRSPSRPGILATGPDVEPDLHDHHDGCQPVVAIRPPACCCGRRGVVGPRHPQEALPGFTAPADEETTCRPVGYAVNTAGHDAPDCLDPPPPDEAPAPDTAPALF